MTYWSLSPSAASRAASYSGSGDGVGHHPVHPAAPARLASAQDALHPGAVPLQAVLELLQRPQPRLVGVQRLTGLLAPPGLVLAPDAGPCRASSAALRSRTAVRVSTRPRRSSASRREIQPPSSSETARPARLPGAPCRPSGGRRRRSWRTAWSRPWLMRLRSLRTAIRAALAAVLACLGARSASCGRCAVAAAPRPPPPRGVAGGRRRPRVPPPGPPSRTAGFGTRSLSSPPSRVARGPAPGQDAASCSRNSQRLSRWVICP